MLRQQASPAVSAPLKLIVIAYTRRPKRTRSSGDSLLSEVPRGGCRAPAEPRADFTGRYPDRREAMARAFRTGV